MTNRLQKDGGSHGGKNRPPADSVQHAGEAGAGVGILGSTGSSCAVRKGSVNENGLGSIDIGDSDDGLVQALVAPIPNEVQQVRTVSVLVAGAGGVGVAATDDGSRLVPFARTVVIGVWVVEWVHVSTI